MCLIPHAQAGIVPDYGLTHKLSREWVLAHAEELAMRFEHWNECRICAGPGRYQRGPLYWFVRWHLRRAARKD